MKVYLPTMGEVDVEIEHGVVTSDPLEFADRFDRLVDEEADIPRPAHEPRQPLDHDWESVRALVLFLGGEILEDPHVENHPERLD